MMNESFALIVAIRIKRCTYKRITRHNRLLIPYVREAQLLRDTLVLQSAGLLGCIISMGARVRACGWIRNLWRIFTAKSRLSAVSSVSAPILHCRAERRNAKRKNNEVSRRWSVLLICTTSYIMLPNNAHVAHVFGPRVYLISVPSISISIMDYGRSTL